MAAETTTGNGEIQCKLQRHQAFWDRHNSEPLLGFSIGDYFVSKRFRAAARLLGEKRKIEPEMIDVGSFRNDYLRMFEESGKVTQDAIFTAAPFTGLPWIEAIMGCPVFSTESSFVARKPAGGSGDIDYDRPENLAWKLKYLEFIEMLVSLEPGLPVGQPILRGPTDAVGTLLGQDTLIYELFDNPQRVERLLERASATFLGLIEEQERRVKHFYSGSSLGFYDLWCPGSSLWFQDDLTSLLSPALYERHILPIHRRLSKAREYNLFHLHPSSFYMIDLLMELEDLRLIEINRDEGGPSVQEMLPVIRRVLAGKNCLLWGHFEAGELKALFQECDPAGLGVIAVVDNPEEAQAMYSSLRELRR